MSLLGVTQQGIVSATKVYTQEVIATKGTFDDQLTAHDLTVADDTTLNGSVTSSALHQKLDAKHDKITESNKLDFNLLKNVHSALGPAGVQGQTGPT